MDSDDDEFELDFFSSAAAKNQSELLSSGPKGGKKKKIVSSSSSSRINLTTSINENKAIIIDDDDDDSDNGLPEADQFGKVRGKKTPKLAQKSLNHLSKRNQAYKILDDSLLSTTTANEGDESVNISDIRNPNESNSSVFVISSDDEEDPRISPTPPPKRPSSSSSSNRRRTTRSSARERTSSSQNSRRRRASSVRGGKRTNKTDKALQKLQSLNKKIRLSSSNENLNPNSLVIMDLTENHDSNDLNSVKIKFKYKYDIVRLSLNKYARLGDVFDKFIDQMGLNPEYFTFYYKENELRRDDTYDGLGMTITSIIDVRYVGPDEDDSEDELSDGEVVDDEYLQLKLRNKNKELTNLKIKYTDKFTVLMGKYAEETGFNLKSLKFIFDGEALDPTETPESLDLEGDEVIDVHCI